jgi:putative hydrolase of the HAD superfamily
MRRAVLFDIGHTLWDWKGGAAHLEDIAAEVAGELRYSDHHHQLMRQALFAAGMQVSRSYNAMDAREVDFLALLAAEMRRLGEPLVPDDAAFIARRLFELEDRISIMPAHVPTTLATLREAGFVLGAISNSPVPGRYLRAILRSRGILQFMDAVISSADVGWRKPDPAIFALGCREVGVAPSRAIYVGDRVREDVRGPHAAGMRGVLTREHRQDEPPSQEPDAELTSLAELPTIAERLTRRESTG